MTGPSFGPDLGWRRVLLLGVLPVVLLALYLRLQFAAADAEDVAHRAEAAIGEPDREACDRELPRGRVVVMVIDSLARDVALDRTTMPALGRLRDAGGWGVVHPCLSQLSLLCLRTIFEGNEPLLATGLKNFSGTETSGPSLVRRWAAHGRRVAAVGDEAMVRTYRDALVEAAVFPPSGDRDAFGREQTMKWLADPGIDAILTLVIDTDAIAHRHGVGAPEYLAKFAEADAFVDQVAAALGPDDTLFILGDHGHDAEGYHSTGIFAPTIYVARGPAFATGEHDEIEMATVRFLLGAATCEGLDGGYQGSVALGLLRLPPVVERSWAPIATTVEAMRARASKAAGPWIDGLAWLALVIGLVWLAAMPAPWPTRLGFGLGFAMVPGFVAPSPLWPWLAGGAALVAAYFAASRGRSRLAGREVLAAVVVVLAWQLAFGVATHLLLVTLQNHVAPPWMVGFWVVLSATIGSLTWVLHRRFAVPRLRALGWVTFAVVYFGLFLGPYYYGVARNLPLALLVLWLGARVQAPDRRTALRWLAAIGLPLVPLGFPVLKEWAIRYPVVGAWVDVMPLGAIGAVAIAYAIVVALLPDRRGAVRLGVVVALDVILGLVLASSPAAIVGTALLILARAAFATDLERAGSRWALAAGDAGFAFMAYFVALGGLRFANVDFAMALQLLPVEWGEGVGAALALPMCVVKYCGPPVLLLLATRRPPELAVAAFTLLALAGRLAALVGIELVAARGSRLFAQLQTQEIAIWMFFHVAVFTTVLLARRRD